ncbi:MAG TPA: hypothetical protein VEW94_06215 [Chloroflexia bacterium]|nr:hypothetical protein [Chloroflexia bacterium]
MIQTETMPGTMAQSAANRFKQANMSEPHPLHPRTREVLEYVREVQQADFALSRALDVAGGYALPMPERGVLLRKRASADAAISRQALLAGRRMGPAREESLEILNGIFKLGSAPQPALDGRFRGQLVTTTFYGPLDSYTRFLSRLWMPWKGKRFNAESDSGDNLLTTSTLVLGRLLWPTFSDYKPLRAGLYTGFDFKTYVGRGVEDPEVSTLKLDYDSPVNPAFILRTVLDELVQVSGNYYLGKAFLRRPDGRYRLAAFFALQKES